MSKCFCFANSEITSRFFDNIALLWSGKFNTDLKSQTGVQKHPTYTGQVPLI